MCLLASLIVCLNIFTVFQLDWFLLNRKYLHIQNGDTLLNSTNIFSKNKMYFISPLVLFFWVVSEPFFVSLVIALFE